MEDTKSKILNHELVSDKRVKIGKWRVSTLQRKGSIEYGKIPALQGMDLEPFRKPPTTYRTIVAGEE